MPGAIGELGFEQPLKAALKRWIICRDASGAMQCDERGACGISVGGHVFELRPAAVLALRVEEVLRGGFRVGSDGVNRPQLENAVLGVLRECFEQPVACLSDAHIGGLFL